MNKKIIYCPKCKEKIGTYDGRSTFNVRYKCKKCKNVYAFNPLEMSVNRVRDIERQCSSGMRYM